MMSNVKKKDVPLISISLVAILFIAAALSLFPQQSADAANAGNRGNNAGKTQT
ncbi:hypothetical protein, partial [Escherichia coli]